MQPACHARRVTFLAAFLLCATCLDAVLFGPLFVVDAAGAKRFFRFVGVMTLLSPNQADWKSRAEADSVGWSPSQNR